LYKYKITILKLPTFLRKIHRFLDGIHLPMLGISLWEMFDIYVRGVFKNRLIAKASAISWSFFLSLFPFLLFLLSILPYLPHYDKLQFYIRIKMRNFKNSTNSSELGLHSLECVRVCFSSVQKLIRSLSTMKRK
jgi:hypothetical protein